MCSVAVRAVMYVQVTGERDVQQSNTFRPIINALQVNSGRLVRTDVDHPAAESRRRQRHQLFTVYLVLFQPSQHRRSGRVSGSGGGR